MASSPASLHSTGDTSPEAVNRPRPVQIEHYSTNGRHSETDPDRMCDDRYPRLIPPVARQIPVYLPVTDSDFYCRLKERFRHKPQEIAKYAEEWMRYVVNKSSADLKAYLELDDDGSLSTEEERQIRVEEMKECRAIAEEIENRFARTLGTVAQKKLSDLRERQEKEAQELWGDEEATDSG